MGSVAAKFRGPNAPAMPAFVGLADSWKADVWGAGHMGAAYEPVKGNELAGRLALPAGRRPSPRLQDRDALRRQFDTPRARPGRRRRRWSDVDRYAAMALDMVVCSGRCGRRSTSTRSRPRLRDAYGRDSVGEKALLARRLVEAGIDLRAGQRRLGLLRPPRRQRPPWGGIEKGLTPLLPTIDRALTTLVDDLEARGLLDSTLVLMMGEFGRVAGDQPRTPAATTGPVMSMVWPAAACGTARSSAAPTARGTASSSAKVTPSDLAATVFRHLDIDPGAHWINPQGRPIPIVTEGGRPISELA